MSCKEIVLAAQDRCCQRIAGRARLFLLLGISVLGVLAIAGLWAHQFSRGQALSELFERLESKRMVGSGNAGALQVARTFGIAKARQLLRRADELSEDYLFDGHSRFVQVEREGYSYDGGASVASDILSLSLIAKVDGDFPPIAAWYGPSGLRIDNLGLTHRGIEIEYHVVARGGSVRQHSVIPWRPFTVPRAGLIGFEYPADACVFSRESVLRPKGVSPENSVRPGTKAE